MKNIYKQGARKEYQICANLRLQGYDIVFRSAGSHSPIDIVAIDSKGRRLLLVQSKRTLNKTMKYIDPGLKIALESEFAYLCGTYECKFIVY